MRYSWVLAAGLLLPLMGAAQATPLLWPRKQVTGKVVFSGLLTWPDTVRTEAQRQALTWRWYRRGLTSDRPVKMRELSQTYGNGTTYGGLPGESCYQLRVAGPDDEGYRLCFRLQLTTGSDGLRYQLDEFEAFSWIFDAGTSFPLEEALASPDAHGQAVLANFRQRLAVALKGW